MLSGQHPVTGPYILGTVRGWELMAKEGSSTAPPTPSPRPLCALSWVPGRELFSLW